MTSSHAVTNGGGEAGLASKEIAAALRLSPRTVEKHVENLLRKTGARSRTELAIAASRPPAT